MIEAFIEVQRREGTGKNVNRRLRTAGWIPAVLYGGGKETVPIQIDHHQAVELLKTVSAENTVFLLQLAGSKQRRHAMIREVQVDPVTRKILHIDFQRIIMTEKVRVRVPIELVGTSVGVKNEGGLLDFVTREVEVACLPGDLPQRIELDVAPLHVGQHVEAHDLKLPPGVELLEEPERVIVSIAHPRVAEEPAEEPAEALLEEEPEEPEVIRRGKMEEEEGTD